MAMRDEVSELIRHGCQREEIISALTVSGRDPDSVRRVLRGLAGDGTEPQEAPRPLPPPVPAALMASVDPDPEYGLPDDSRLVNRIEVYEAAIGKTQAETCAALPYLTRRYVRDTLQELCKPWRGLPAILRRVKCRYERAKDRDMIHGKDARRVGIRKALGRNGLA